MTKTKSIEKQSKTVREESEQSDLHERSELSERSERSERRRRQREQSESEASVKRAKLQPSMLSSATIDRTFEAEREQMIAEMANLKAEREALLREKTAIEEENHRLSLLAEPKPKKNNVREVSAPLPPTLKHVSVDAMGNLPTDVEIVVVHAATPIADAILDRYAAAVDTSALLKLVLTATDKEKTQRSGSAHVSQGFAAKLVTALRRASVMRLQDTVRTLKSYLTAHGQRTCCLACEAARKTSKPAKKIEGDLSSKPSEAQASASSKTGGVQAPAAAASECREAIAPACNAAACRETSAEAAAVILSTTDLEPLLAFVRAKFPTVATLERLLGDRFNRAIMGESFDISSEIDVALVPIATRVINDLRTIHHKIIHVVEVEAEVDGSYELEISTTARNVFACGVYELYSNGSSEDRITFVADRFLTAPVIADLEARYKKDRLQQRRNSRRASKKASAPEQKTTKEPENNKDKEEESEEEEENNDNDKNEENNDGKNNDDKNNNNEEEEEESEEGSEEEEEED